MKHFVRVFKYVKLHPKSTLAEVARDLDLKKKEIRSEFKLAHDAVGDILLVETSPDVETDMRFVRDKERGKYTDKKYKDALRLIEQYEKEFEAYRAITVPPSMRFIAARKSSKSANATALVMASDWHVDEIVKSSTVQRLNTYTPDIAKERADNFFRRLVKLVARNRTDTTINNLLLVLGGDFISSNIHEELLEITAMPPLEAIMYAQDLLDSGLRFLKDKGGFKKIVVVCTSGNHGRITEKMRHQTRNGNSLEWAMYQNLAKRHPDLQWVIEDGYLTYYSVYDKVVRIHHGDAIRYIGGVGGLEIPMKRAYYQWNMTRPADINLMGHYHSYMPGYNTVNGSLIGYNAYAAQNKFPYQPPMQAFILLDAQRGITVHAPILV